MTVRNNNYFTDGATGAFRDNTTKDILPLDVRDLTDSTLYVFNEETITSSDFSGSVGQIDLVTCSSLGAGVSWKLPTTADVGDRCGLYLVTDAPYTEGNELFIKSGGAGDLIDGTDYSTNERTRLFKRGEYLMFLCVNATNPDWTICRDGRIPASAMIQADGTNAQTVGGGNGAFDWNGNLQSVGYGASAAGDGFIPTVGNRTTPTPSGLAPRRDCHLNMILTLQSQNGSVADGSRYIVGLWNNTQSSLIINHSMYIGATGTAALQAIAYQKDLDAGDVVVSRFQTSDTSDCGVGSGLANQLICQEQLK